MRWFLFPILLLSLALRAGEAGSPAVGRLNEALRADWRRAELAAVPAAPDEVFLRRARIDLTGRAPRPEEVKKFCADRDPGKRSKLIRQLLGTPEYADMMAMRYADMFRIKAEFPINLWPNAVQLFHRYLRDAARLDRPWDQMARELLTASGSNFRVPAANFFRASADRTPEGATKLALLTFLNISKVPQKVLKGVAPLFGRIRYKSTAEWKEEIVFCDPLPCTVEAVLPDGTSVSVDSPAVDPREVFADWVLRDQRRVFARAAANRVWYWLFGRGLADPVDNMAPQWEKPWWRFSLFAVKPDLNAYARCVNDEVLDLLADELIRADFRIGRLIELISCSDAYNADWKTLPAEQLKAMEHFAVYPVRRHDAEVIVDLVSDVTGTHETYRSVIPEPFTLLPPGTRAVQIADGSISSSTLDTFGRPPRDSGLISERNGATTGAQRLYLMNSSFLYKGIAKRSRELARSRLPLPELIDRCYLLTLSRHATPQERTLILGYGKKLPQKERRVTLAADLLWSLVNSKEFLFHH